MQNPLQDYLSQIPFSADELNLMFPLIKPLNLNKGEFFVTPETVGPKICFIQKGMLRNYIKINKKEVTYHFGVESTSIGAMSIFIASYQSIEYIQAVEDCELLVANYPDIVNLFQQSINWANLGRLIGEKNYIEAHFRMTSFLIHSAEERYELLSQRIPEVFQRVPLYQIASYLGIEPQSLSRIRRNKMKGKK